MSLREPNMMEWKKEKKEEVNINKTKYRILFYSNFLKERNRIKIIFVRKYDRNLKLIFF